MFKIDGELQTVWHRTRPIRVHPHVLHHLMLEPGQQIGDATLRYIVDSNLALLLVGAWFYKLNVERQHAR